MRDVVTVFLCGTGLIFLGCQQQETPAKRAATKGGMPSDARNAKANTVIRPVPTFMNKSLLGSELGPDGAVTKESSTFRKGEPIYLTLLLRESPPGLQTRAVWYDETQKELQTERKQMNGGKMATFALKTPKLKPGTYHVIGYWGGNIAADKTFEIAAPAKRGKT